VIIEAVEAASAPSVIAMPPPATETENIPAADLESVGATPEVGEAPAAIDEVVPPAATDLAPSRGADTTPTELPAETDITAAEELAEQQSDETSEGGIAPPEPEAAAETEAEPEAKDEKPNGTVPPVVPEPKS
jgi:CPA2 family monovalent cation:H+ antiporter-2